MSAENNVPAIRFEGFSGAWEEKVLDDEVDLFSGLTYSPSDVVKDNGTFVLRSSNVKNGEIVQADNVYVKAEVVNSENVRVGDIVIVVRNGSRSLIGKHAAVKQEMNNTVIGAFMTGMHTEQTNFINALLDTNQFNKEIEKNLGATINQITNGALRKMKFYFSKPEEQTKIGNYFQQLDTLIAQHQKKHDKLLNIKKALLEKLFPKQGATEPELRFKGFSGEWEEKALGEIGSFKSGSGFSEEEQNGQLGLPYFKVSDMNIEGNQAVMVSANNYVDEEQIARLKYKPISEKSIVFAKVGAAIFLERKRIAENFLIDNNMMAFSPSENVDFIKLWFDSIALSKYAQIGALPSYNATDLKIIELCVPLKEEQTKIGNLFKQLDTLITQHQAQLKKLNNIKQACLEKMFV